MRLDAARIERHVDVHLAVLREQLHTQVLREGSVSLDVAAAYMRASYAKGYTDGLTDENPSPFAADAERLLRSRASLSGNRARRRGTP